MCRSIHRDIRNYKGDWVYNFKNVGKCPNGTGDIVIFRRSCGTCYRTCTLWPEYKCRGCKLFTIMKEEVFCKEFFSSGQGIDPNKLRKIFESLK